MTDTIETKPITKRSRRMAREPEPAVELDSSISATTPKVDPKSPRPSSKSSLVLQMLERPEGATIVQIVTATAWLPHTARAALAGLKKKGQHITSEKAKDEKRIYRVAAD